MGHIKTEITEQSQFCFLFYESALLYRAIVSDA